jgi:hypothetical protein
MDRHGKIDGSVSSLKLADDIIRVMAQEAGIKSELNPPIIGTYDSPARPHIQNLLTKITGIIDRTHMKKIIKVYMDTVDKREPTSEVFNELRTRIDDIIKNPDTPIETDTIIADYIKFIDSTTNHKHWWLIDIDRLRGIVNKQR